MLLIVGTIRIPPENLDQARTYMAEVVTSSRAEAGCVEYCYAEDLFDPGLIHIKERWTDQAALDRHFAAPHMPAWRAAWPTLSIGERSLRLYEVGEPRPV